VSTPPLDVTDWLPRALAEVAAGRCPNHGLPLTVPHRFCHACECVYSIKDGDTVVAVYYPDRWP
jgi:hypothetical protein